jgi:hypothetical protein
MHSNKIYEKEPVDMIVNNVKKYAYVVLLTKIEYFPGALVLAESLCTLGTEADLVILVSSNIPESIRMILRRFFSKIIQIKRVSNIDEKYNKLQALTLIEYYKVIVIDIDTIILKYPDYLFTLDTPAVYMNKRGQGSESGSGAGEGVYSGLYVLTPSISIYNKIMDTITNERGYKETINYIFTKVNKYNSIINSNYLGIKYSNNRDNVWKKSFMIQFVGDKPFLYKSRYSIEERVDRDDNKLWFFYYSKIINKNFNLLQVKELDDVNNLSRYYLSELSRQIYTMTKILQLNVNTSVDGKFTSRLNKIFKTDKIKKNFVYYHIDSLKEYNCTYAPSPPTPPSPSSLITSGKHKVIDEEIRDVSLKIETRHDYKMKGYVIKNILVVLETELTYTERMDIINNMYKDDDKYYYISVIVIIYNDKLQFKNTDNIKVYEDVNSKMKLLSILTNNTLTNNTLTNNTLTNNTLTNNTLTNNTLTNNTLTNNTLTNNTLTNNTLTNNTLTNNTLTNNTLTNNTLTNNTLNMIESKKLDFFKKYSNILENLKFQSLKKWIYNNYSYTELQLLLITQAQTSSPCQDYEYIIIDSNNYSNDIIIKNKVDLKLFFFDIIFTKSSLYKNKCVNISKYKENGAGDGVYTIDGINIAMPKITTNEISINER